MSAPSVVSQSFPTLATACPLCGAASTARLVVRGIPVKDCVSCDHRFADFQPAENHVASTYGADYFEGGGAGYADYLAKSRSLRRQGFRYGELLRFQGLERGRVLDVGAAAGFLLAGFAEAGWGAVGLDPSASMVEYGRSVLGVELHQSTLENAAQLDLGVFDVVSLIQVLPHFVDPRLAVKTVRGFLAPEGHCLIETWDRRSLTARGFGSRWHEYDPPSVLHWFSQAGVAELFAEEGFQLVASGRARKSIDGSNARALLNHRFDRTGADGEGVHSIRRSVVDRLEVRYPGDDAFWMLVRRVD